MALVAGGLRPGGIARIVASVTPTDERSIGASVADGGLRTLMDALAEASLHVAPPRPYGTADALELRSSWAKRLGVPARRPATVLEVRRVVDLGEEPRGPAVRRVVA